MSTSLRVGGAMSNPGPSSVNIAADLWIRRINFAVNAVRGYRSSVTTQVQSSMVHGLPAFGGAKGDQGSGVCGLTVILIRMESRGQRIGRLEGEKFRWTEDTPVEHPGREPGSTGQGGQRARAKDLNNREPPFGRELRAERLNREPNNQCSYEVPFL